MTGLNYGPCEIRRGHDTPDPSSLDISVGHNERRGREKTIKTPMTINLIYIEIPSPSLAEVPVTGRTPTTDRVRPRTTLCLRDGKVGFGPPAHSDGSPSRKKTKCVPWSSPSPPERTSCRRRDNGKTI